MLKVSAPELVSGVSGESEQKLRELFELAVVSSAVFLFFFYHCTYFYKTVETRGVITGRGKDPLFRRCKLCH